MRAIYLCVSIGEPGSIKVSFDSTLCALFNFVASFWRDPPLDLPACNCVPGKVEYRRIVLVVHVRVSFGGVHLLFWRGGGERNFVSEPIDKSLRHGLQASVSRLHRHVRNGRCVSHSWTFLRALSCRDASFMYGVTPTVSVGRLKPADKINDDCCINKNANARLANLELCAHAVTSIN